MDSNDDEKVVTSKTLDDFDQSTGTCVVKGESLSVDMTNSTSMGVKRQENGSENNGGGGGGGGGDGVSVPVVEELMGEENVADGGEIEMGVKGVDNGEGKGEFPNGNIDSGEKLSGIARRTRNKAETEGFKDEEVDVKGSENGNEVDGENPFSFGDFVWGKIKSHPWWPGRIYDPSNASEFALKYKNEGCLLVAYFGDRTFAWCDPSQLKPFEENFEEMSKQSSLKTFVSAVEEAKNEFGRLVKLQMTCSCAQEKGGQSFSPFVVNGGIKEGVCVPENGVSSFSIAQFEPLTILEEVRRLALFDLVCNSLEQAVLKARLSAFYDAKYGCSLTIYCEPISIEDPMDDGGVPKEVSFKGQNDGPSLMGSEDRGLGPNPPRTPLDMEEEGRKSKTVAELLRRGLGNELEEDNDRTETPIGNSLVKSRKKGKVIENIVLPKIEKQSGKRVDKSERRREKSIDTSQRNVTDSTRVTRSSAQKKGAPGKSTTSEKKVSKDIKDGGSSVPRVGKKGINVSVNDEPRIEEGYERISPRERKLSKYLSPPYTILLQRQRSSSSLLGSDQAQGLVSNDGAKMGESMTKEDGNLVSSPIVKCSPQNFQKSSKSTRSKLEKTEHSDLKKTKRDPSSKVGDSMDSLGSLNGVLREIRSAACDPLDSKKHKSFDLVKGFVSSYRSSKYKNGPNYESFKKRAKSSSGTKHWSNPKVANEVDQTTPKPKPRKRSATRRDELKSESKVNNHEASCEPSSKRKKKAVQNEKKTESSKKKEGSKSKEPKSEPLAVILIKQKLESMTAMLEQTDGRMTWEIKSKLESESKDLLKKVKMMTASSS